MAGPDSFVTQTRQQNAAGQLPELGQVRTAGTATRPATAAQPGSIQYMGQQVAEETVASQYQRAKGYQTAEWLVKAAGHLIEPKMKELQSSQVMKGIQDAAAGKSMDEIIAEQPWYTQIFGESDLVTSARAYKAQEAVSNFVTQVQREIPDMASKTPQEARAYMTQKWLDFQTGDPLTDAVANQQFLNAAPGLFEQYSKQNYKNWQQNAAASQQGAYGAMSSSFNAKATTMARDQTVSKDDVLKSAGEFIEGLAPVQGQSFSSWSDNLIATVQNSANKNEYHAVNAILQSGLVDRLPPEQQAALKSYVSRTEAMQHQNVRIDPRYNGLIQDLQYKMKTGHMSSAEVLGQIQGINNQAQAEYGFMTPLIGADEAASWAGAPTDLLISETNRQRTAMLTEQQRQAQKRQDIAGKADADRREIELGAKYFSSGAQFPAGSSTEPMQKAGAMAFDAMEKSQPGMGYKALVSSYNNNNGFVVNSLQARFTSMLNTADKMEWTPEFDKAVSAPFLQMTQQEGGHFAAMRYFGSDNYKKLQNYASAMNNGVPQGLAYHEAFVEPQRLGKTADLSKKDQERLDKNIGDGFFASFFRDTLSDSGKAAIRQSAAGHYADLKSNARYADDDARAKEAVGLAMHDGKLAVYGKWAWDRDNTATPFHEQVHLSSDQLYGVLHTYLEQQPSLKGANLDNASFVERVNDKGGSDLIVYAPAPDGKWRMSMVSANDVTSFTRTIRDQQRAERENISKMPPVSGYTPFQ